MADPQKPSKTHSRGPRLSALERLSPVPDMDTIADEIAARTKAGDVVLELHGRGGWITRGAIDALRQQPDGGGYELAAILNNRALLYRNLGRYDEAVVMFERAAELDPRSSVPLFNQWMLLVNQLRRPRAAEAVARRALALGPEPSPMTR